MQEGIKEGEKKADLKIGLQATQMKTLKAGLEGAKEQLELKKEKVEELMEKVGALQREVVDKNGEIEDVR
jgi:hypothetical protein